MWRQAKIQQMRTRPPRDKEREKEISEWDRYFLNIRLFFLFYAGNIVLKRVYKT